MRFFIGGRGSDMGGEGVGIGVVTAGDADSPLASGALAHRGDAVETPSPTWIARHPSAPVVYAALEGARRVAAFRRTGETTLEPLGSVAAGEAVCHVAVAPDGSRLVASCWGDGRVVHVPLAPDGRPGEPALAAAAVDPYRAIDTTPTLPDDDGPIDPVAAGEDPAQIAARLLRQATGEPDPFDDPAVREVMALARRAEREATAGAGLVLPAPAPDAADEPRPSRAHAALFLPDGRVATTDLGYDLVRFWRVGPGGLVPDHEVVLPFGSGPRHLLLHPSGFLHVVTELTCEVFVLASGAGGRWALRAGAQTGAADGDTAAELAASRDGRHLYAGLRGSDTISVLRVGGDGDRLERVALAESGVVKPRHHVIVRDTLLVAGQGSNEIVSLPIDERTGFPGRVRHRLAYPAPTCLLPVP